MLATIVIIVAFQATISLPFTLVDHKAYMNGAFDFSRQFLYKWSTNWQFLDEAYFLSTPFHNLLLVLNLSGLVLFLMTKTLGFNPA
jgi:alpha-1,3-mannosyltransferase